MDEEESGAPAPHTPPMAALSASPQASSAAAQLAYTIVKKLPPGMGRCLNDDAIWTISSARADSAINELLQESNEELFWQSDGVTPHTIQVQFYKRESVSELAIYVDHPRDESYTPQSFIIRSGSMSTDLEELRKIHLAEASPCGWVRVPLGDPSSSGMARYHRTSYLSITITAMYANGRDTHLRGVRVLGPVEASRRSGITESLEEVDSGDVEWQTAEMLVQSSVR